MRHLLLPNRAKRMECVELAPALAYPNPHDSGSKLHALSRSAGLRAGPCLANVPAAVSCGLAR